MLCDVGAKYNVHWPNMTVKAGDVTQSCHVTDVKNARQWTKQAIRLIFTEELCRSCKFRVFVVILSKHHQAGLKVNR